MRRYAFAFSLAALAALAPSAEAQLFEEPKPEKGPPRAFFGADFLVAVPTGQFAHYVNNGFGVGAHFLWQFDEPGIMALRIDGNLMIYGHETFNVPLSPTTPRIRVDVTTNNNIGSVHIGPQLMVPNGLFRPYVNAGFGFSNFFTYSSVEGSRDEEPFASSTNYSDFIWSWTAGGGIYIPVSRRGTPVSIDLGARYHRNGQTRYLREGSIIEDGTGDIDYEPIQSETNLLVYQIGISIGLR